MEDLVEMCVLIGEIIKRTNKLNKTAVLAGFMMLMEEWCKANNENMVETFNQMNEMCKEVNAEFGEYGNERHRKEVIE